jgi:hypothetical protein
VDLAMYIAAVIDTLRAHLLSGEPWNMALPWSVPGEGRTCPYVTSSEGLARK